MPNQFGVDYAYPGTCSLCHDEIAVFEGSRQVRAGVVRPIIKRILGKARLARIELDDNSKMSVAMCKTCFNAFKPEDAQELMESEINGWQVEVNEVVNGWDDERKIKYMKRYAKRFMTDRVDKRWNKIQKAKIKKPRKSKLKVRTK